MTDYRDFQVLAFFMFNRLRTTQSRVPASHPLASDSVRENLSDDGCAIVGWYPFDRLLSFGAVFLTRSWTLCRLALVIDQTVEL